MKLITKSTLALFIMSALMSFALTANAQNNDSPQKLLEAFPAAKEGMVRHVIFLKKQKDESLYKVEIIPGKMMNVDCNNHSIIGTLDQKDLEGWGYNYFEFNTKGLTRSTMMMCNKPNTDRFITSETQIIRYNSKLPIVVYAPEGYEIQYRIWKADKKTKTASEE